MDLTRSDILALLGCLKVSLPKAIKLSEEDLHKRLSQALDPSQSSDKVIAPIKPLDYGTWPSSSQPLSEALRRGNLMEATQNSLIGLTQDDPHFDQGGRYVHGAQADLAQFRASV
jgi:hypothetical protein